uniref:Putative secreted protein n=1 Tax=Anopheles darlingi TaxID=43151 RepID=A0A2M4D297_ANODA
MWPHSSRIVSRTHTHTIALSLSLFSYSSLALFLLPPSRCISTHTQTHFLSFLSRQFSFPFPAIRNQCTPHFTSENLVARSLTHSLAFLAPAEAYHALEQKKNNPAS